MENTNGVRSMCMSSPKVVAPPPPPTPEPAPEPITTTSSEVSEQAKRAKAQTRQQAQKRAGRSSTILTGSLGLDEEARTGKTILGS